jgi:hypothetical protein
LTYYWANRDEVEADLMREEEEADAFKREFQRDVQVSS